MTASGHKRAVGRVTAIGGTVAIVGLLAALTWVQITRKSSPVDCAFRVSSSEVSTGRSFDNYAERGNCIRLGRATTPADREKGLSGRAFMPQDEGLLFVFEPPQEACLWMKDMHFSLDMIWLDSSKTITHIEENVSPASYPKSYCGSGMTAYVIEINAGMVTAARLHVGDKLSL